MNNDHTAQPTPSRAASGAWQPAARDREAKCSASFNQVFRALTTATVVAGCRGFETSDLRPDESTTNIGLFKAGTGAALEHVDQPLIDPGRASRKLLCLASTGAYREFG